MMAHGMQAASYQYLQILENPLEMYVTSEDQIVQKFSMWSTQATQETVIQIQSTLAPLKFWQIYTEMQWK